MQSSWCVFAAAAAAVFVGGSAFAATPAAFRGEATLASAASVPRTETIDGVRWTCDGDACNGVAQRKANLDGPVRECRKVVAVLGAVSAYRTGPRELTAGQIRACNAGAAEVVTAAK
ncbi:MAG: hypothetical protein JNL41_08295 [Phenylobacterium sp.]|uniref:CC_3452 family protein n=1 Tax=Phenylobacterium sp. TaxID=1871053 RepID=UPI001A427C09|nr:hypothetical protein [Phenylobacterium sp.]MBL8554264.1 hypothetical protein [Phenylobacterium sp.]